MNTPRRAGDVEIYAGGKDVIRKKYNKINTKKLPNENQVNINKEMMRRSKTDLIREIYSLRERLWEDIEFIDRREKAKATERYHRQKMKEYVNHLIKELNKKVLE